MTDLRRLPAPLREVISDVLNSKLGACTESCLDSLTLLVERERERHALDKVVSVLETLTRQGHVFDIPQILRDHFPPHA
jgi:hypothetical protein